MIFDLVGEKQDGVNKMRDRKYSVICILEGQVSAGSKQEAQRIVEDALLKAFDSEATKDSNPEISRLKICVGTGFATICEGESQDGAEE